MAVPRRDCTLVIARMKGPRDHIPLTPLDDLSFDLAHGPAIELSVSYLFAVRIARPTHDDNCSIALTTDLLRSSMFFPSNPRSRA